MAQVIKRFNIAAGKAYTTRNGEDKKQWVNLGRATQWDDGGISLEFNAFPAGNWWDGKASLFEQDESREQGGQSQQQRPARQQQSAPSAQQTAADLDDSIPF